MDDELKHYINQYMQEQNSRSIAGFEGYSPEEMHQLVYNPYSAGSPLQVLQPAEVVYEQCPIYRMAHYLLTYIQTSGEVKLTAKGYLPVKLVKELYDQGFIEEEHISLGITKLYKEQDSLSINLTRNLLQIGGITKKRKGQLSLTASGIQILQKPHKLFESLLKTMTLRFNWGYYDAYENEYLGQTGFGFTFILIAKYGSTKRTDDFYGEKYIKAFPEFTEILLPEYRDLTDYLTRCYSIRMFERFMEYFGLIKLTKEGMRMERKHYIQKTEFFDQIIQIRPHQKTGSKG